MNETHCFYEMSFLGSSVENEKVVIINAKALILSKTSGTAFIS